MGQPHDDAPRPPLRSARGARRAPHDPGRRRPDDRTGGIGPGSIVTARLESGLGQNSWLWEILRRFDEIGLPDCWIVAGYVAQTVWNLACGRAAGFGIKDADLVYFDAADLSAETETEHEKRLRAQFSDLPV